MTSREERESFGHWDFGLDVAQEERAKAVHSDSIIVDSLFQGPCGYRSFPPDVTKELDQIWVSTKDPLAAMDAAQSVLPQRAAEGKFPEFEACWVLSGITAGSIQIDVGSYERFEDSITKVERWIDAHSWIVKAKGVDDIRRAKVEEKRSYILNSQPSPAFPISRDLSIIEHAYARGLRMLMLTYNSQDFVGAGCTERVDGGLSNFGVELVHLLNELGVIIDTSHCGRNTTLDACKFSRAAVVASHASAKTVYAHDRGKSDEEIRAIAETGGVVSVCAVPFFLSDQISPTLDVMFDHIDYIVDLVGGDHVGIGTDWPLMAPKSILHGAMNTLAEGIGGFRKEHRIESEKNLLGFDDYRDFLNITRGLVRRGYNDQDIRKILGENFLRLFEQVCG